MGREMKGERMLLSSECVQSQNNGRLITIARREKKTGSSIPRLSIKRGNVELAVRDASVDVGEGRKSRQCRTIGIKQ